MPGGDVLFVPTGWRHHVASKSVEGVAYVTVNAFVPGADRVGLSAMEHAEIAASAFPEQDGNETGGDAAAVFRAAEAAYRVDDADQWWAQDFHAPHGSPTRDPSTYRVRRAGPFQYVQLVEPVERVLTAELTDALFSASDGLLPVYVEGSQSPISMKRPYSGSDLDVLVAVREREELGAARKVCQRLADAGVRSPVPLSIGIVHADWLKLPNFYTALSLDPNSADRHWWRAEEEERQAEALRRVQAGIRRLGDAEAMNRLFSESVALMGRDATTTDHWRLIPRWLGLG